jgi:isopentenyl phosphate kinase
MEAIHRTGLPAVTLSPAASVTAHDGKPFIWDVYQLQSALDNGLLPVIHGDVVFDDLRGGTILSTEDLFSHLARILHPGRILLAGLEAGVWEDFPERRKLLAEITPGTFSGKIPVPGSADGTDVTGGMQSKVSEMLELVGQVEDLEVLIFSGEEKDAIRNALLGASPGTRVHR